MRWSRVCIEAIAVELPAERVASSVLEARLAPLYGRFRLAQGQLESLTGVRERRFWPPDTSMASAAAAAGRKALDAAQVDGSAVGTLVYGGVCRDDLEPATAVRVADALGVGGDAFVLDHANACLGVLSGMVTVANRIELGQADYGLVVSAESAREIADDTIERMLAAGDLSTWSRTLASLTGGSGAVAVLLADAERSRSGRSLLGGALRAAPQHHALARWGPKRGLLGRGGWVMETDGPGVLHHGVELGARTWSAFQQELGWPTVDKAICHQVGSAHQQAILARLGIPPEREFATFATLGNTGTVALPATAALADAAGFLRSGDRVGLLGIGTGLNCLMLGVSW